MKCWTIKCICNVGIYAVSIVVQNVLFLFSDADFYHPYIKQIDHVPLDSEGYQELNICPDGVEVSRSILVSKEAHRTISNRRIAYNQLQV
jgi:hypothetical protein